MFTCSTTTTARLAKARAAAPATRRALRRSGSRRAPFSSLVNQRRRRVRVPVPATKPPAAAAALNLPKVLPRPAKIASQLDLSALNPELAGVPLDYVRDALSSMGTSMLASVAQTVFLPSSSGIQNTIDCAFSAPCAHLPTHVFAVYPAECTASPMSPRQAEKQKASLYPAHGIVFAAHCTNLSALPSTSPEASSSKTTIPIVRLAVPSPSTFAPLQQFLYTHDENALLSTLLPSSSPSHAHALNAVATITGFWKNVCALGVTDSKLWNVMDQAWANALQRLAVYAGPKPDTCTVVPVNVIAESDL